MLEEGILFGSWLGLVELASHVDMYNYVAAFKWYFYYFKGAMNSEVLFLFDFFSLTMLVEGFEVVCVCVCVCVFKGVLTKL